MVITNLEEKQNRKLWVPIRGGNRGGWSLFDWEKVRDMPYRDREMYLGNSAKIGVLDKGGKWRKKDWYLHRNDMSTGDQLTSQMDQARKRDQLRMHIALGIDDLKEKEQKLTPAELQALLKKVRGNKEEPVPIESSATGLGFDKMKVEIRARPNAKSYDPHKLQGTAFEQQQKPKKEQKHRQQVGRSRSRSEKRKKKHKKDRRQDRSKSRQKHRKRQHRERSQSQVRQKKRKQKRHRHHSPAHE